MIGVLLINLGTPDAPTPSAVRRTLRQFLLDPFVIDIPALFRWILVYLFILPFRPKKTAKAYSLVWTPQGSPLLVYSQELAQKTAKALGSEFTVRLGMRYGNPSLKSAYDALIAAGATRIIGYPLYPQYSLAATRSSIVEVERIHRGAGASIPLQWMDDFYNEPGFIDAVTETTQGFLKNYRWDHLFFSFHGLPERQIKKIDETGAHCLNSENCCNSIVSANRRCYRAQCYATARTVAAKLGLSQSQYSVGFQSRLGRTPWIKPYSDLLYPKLAQKGVRRLAVLSPSFVADCLETLEEIQIRARNTFIQAGGEDLKLVPCVNGSDRWVQAVVDKVRTVSRQAI